MLCNKNPTRGVGQFVEVISEVKIVCFTSVRVLMVFWTWIDFSGYYFSFQQDWTVSVGYCCIDDKTKMKRKQPF